MMTNFRKYKKKKKNVMLNLMAGVRACPFLAYTDG